MIRLHVAVFVAASFVGCGSSGRKPINGPLGEIEKVEPGEIEAPDLSDIVELAPEVLPEVLPPPETFETWELLPLEVIPPELVIVDVGCVPDCTGKDCGWNGCDGLCGLCKDTEECMDSICVLTTELKGLCEICSTDAECLEGYVCLKYDYGIKFCSAPCDSYDDCISGTFQLACDSDGTLYEAGFCYAGTYLGCHDEDIWQYNTCDHPMFKYRECEGDGTGQCEAMGCI